MNKQQKIIVSIVGITIVLLALLGITYAYYLTRIEGNTNTNSISITTADLKLEYGDGNGLLTATNITPGKQVEFKTTGNQTTTEKTFTVTNSGNSTIEGYAVSLDYAYIADTMPSIFEHPEDFQITLTCSTNKIGETCNGFTGNFNNESIMLTSNDIEQDEIHSYSLSIYYNDPGVDQSNDMGKNLNLKVQIYNINETTDIEGTITGVDSTHSVRIESEPKMSTIVNGKYNFKGVEIGTHTLTILDKDGNEIDKEYIVVKSGTNPGITTTKVTIDDTEVAATEISITKDKRVVKLNTKVESNTLSFDITTSGTEAFNPYHKNKNSLAYHIINNAIKIKEDNDLGYAMYSSETITTPGIGLGNMYVTGAVETDSATSSSSTTGWVVYGTDYELDKDGDFTLKEPQVAKYRSMYNSLKGQYITTKSTYSTEQSALEALNKNNFDTLYKVENSSTTSYLYTKQLIKTFETNEKILVPEKDNDGISYYYRGGVTNNYVEFAGICWRIVRIQGDGSIKLILSKKSSCSSITSEDTNSALINVDNLVFYGYKYDSNYEIYMANYENYSNEKGLYKLLKEWYDTYLTQYSEKIKNDIWCLGGNINNKYDYTSGRLLSETEIENIIAANEELKWYYAAGKRFYLDKKPSLICGNDEDKITAKIGSITVDEALFAGMSSKYRAAYNERETTYLHANTEKNNWWTLSRAYLDGHLEYAFNISSESIKESINATFVTNFSSSGIHNARPTIVLIPNIKITGGDGTQSNPYVVE